MIPTISLVTITSTLSLGSLTGIAVAIALMLLLITKEIADCTNFSVSVRIARITGIYISPLLVAFVAIVILNVIQILN